VDFSDANVAATKINGDVSRATKGVIPDLLQSSDVARALFVLTNAVYFKGAWETAFDSSQTKPQPFYDHKNKEIASVPMIARTGDFNSGFSAELKAGLLEIPYANSNISMIVMLPEQKAACQQLTQRFGPVRSKRQTNPCQEEQGIAPTLAALTPQRVESALQRDMESVKMLVALPKFELEKQAELEPTLHSMGLTKLMSPQADLTDFSNANLFVNAIVHKAAITVNEAGTEAAAATGGIIPLSRPETFWVDRPFVFLLRDNHLKTTLFAGAVQNPAAARS